MDRTRDETAPNTGSSRQETQTQTQDRRCPENSQNNDAVDNANAVAAAAAAAAVGAASAAASAAAASTKATVRKHASALCGTVRARNVRNGAGYRRHSPPTGGLSKTLWHDLSHHGVCIHGRVTQARAHTERRDGVWDPKTRGVVGDTTLAFPHTGINKTCRHRTRRS